MHLDDRISLEPGTPQRGQKVRVEYRGLLAQSGADTVWAHTGMDGWKSIQDIPMERTPEGNFSCVTEASASQEMNMCFKDSANNWDNNSGQDWTFRLS